MNKQAEHFRRGVLRAFADSGLSPAEIEAGLEKKAWVPFAVMPTNVGGFLRTLIDIPTAIAVGGSAGAGILGAKMLHNSINSDDPKEIDKFKNQKLINEYKFQIESLKKRRQQAGNQIK